MFYDNEISMGIMEKKYLQPGETPEQWLDRVVSIFSPDLQDDIRYAISQADFLPAGRTLAGAGLKGKRKMSTSNCFLAGTKVLTERGLVNIEDVHEGDMVVTSRGLRKVNTTMCRKYVGDVFLIDGKGLYDTIRCTPNHKFKTSNGWLRADRIFGKESNHIGCRLQFLQHEFKKEYDDVYLGEHFIQSDKQRLVNNGDTITIATNIKNREGWHVLGQIHPVNRTLCLDDDMRYFIGRWLGDGSATARKGKRNPSILQMVFNAKTEVAACNRCIAIGTKAFGFAPAIRETKQNVISVRWENEIVTSWFAGEFGTKCDGKFIPDKYLGDLHIAMGLLDSDGCISSHGTISITLKNKRIIDWLKDTLVMNGIKVASVLPTIHQDTYKLQVSASSARKFIIPHITRSYFDKRLNVTRSNEDADWVLVSKVSIEENVHTMVYNLSVEDVHEYNVNGVICHNCYICPSPKDNIESIFDTAKMVARISSYGGGCGIALDNLRPKDALVNNSARSSTGAVSFLNLFDVTSGTIGQSGRRGALMVGLRCDHPDIYEFLRVKENNEKLASMNISIKFTNEFMEAVHYHKKFHLHFESEHENIERDIDAAEFFEEFCKVNADWGDPGCIFIDRVRKYHLLSGYPEYQIDISNPCAEYYGIGGNSCNLGSINLYNMIDDKFTPDAHVNYERLGAVVGIGVRALDEILSYGYDMQPLDLNRKVIDDWRSIGLGIFGLADALVAMGIRYGSEESIDFVSEVMEYIMLCALEASSDLAHNLGSFGKYDFDKICESPIIQAFPDMIEKIKVDGLRNGSLLSIAPTGTISLFAGRFTGGVEPMYQVAYERTSHSTEDEGKTFFVYARGVEDLLKFHGIDPQKITVDEIKARFPFVIESHEVPWKERVALQSAMQFYVDNSISSTVNLPNSATWEDIRDIYMLAWAKGLKGITVFRDGCKRGNILGVSKDEPVESTYNMVEPLKRGSTYRVDGSTFKQRTACVPSMYVTVNKSDTGDLMEVFTNASGGCQANINTITRLVSLLLRAGVKRDIVIEELRENQCPACQALRRQGKSLSLSCGNAIADAMTAMLDDETTVEHDGYLVCPECGKHTLRPEGKCFTCSNCGYSKCD